jgi:hypothetical protein
LVHLVWTTYERSALIRHDIEQALWAPITAQCKKLGAAALRIGGIALSKLDNPHQAELEPLNLPAPSRLQPASYA